MNGEPLSTCAETSERRTVDDGAGPDTWILGMRTPIRKSSHASLGLRRIGTELRSLEQLVNPGAAPRSKGQGGCRRMLKPAGFRRSRERTRPKRRETSPVSAPGRILQNKIRVLRAPHVEKALRELLPQYEAVRRAGSKDLATDNIPSLHLPRVEHFCAHHSRDWDACRYGVRKGARRQAS
ncbi:hypothetical protein EJ06DRAFT_377387 [Trichodelitschia bisporula]|uniref:Uncharacterized protein n=1 Tax=Trichodelitschia bisporula TaxID=703511 RepID=A0A6G1HZ74_9PEZI|nr:hypothetical protein EJ06DRAFT_377387 [Trichodelitschia bisporula]